MRGWRAAAAAAILIAICACAEASDRVRLVFIGDVMAHMPQVTAAKTKDGYDFRPQFARVLPLFEGAEVIANFETVMAGSREKFSGYPTFNTPDELADALAWAGIRTVTVSNNHALDRREGGLLRTLDVMDRAGIRWTGAARRGDPRFEPLVIERDGFRIALLNYTYGTNVPPSAARSADVRLNVISEQNIRAGLARARAASPDIIAVCPHWGDEYVYEPRDRDIRTAALCIEGGADLVIGTHPHVLQRIEPRSRDGAPAAVAWSLGNFVSNQRTEPRERSVILAADFVREEGRTRLVRIAVAPTWVSVRQYEGRRRYEVLYAGSGGSSLNAGVPASELKRARDAGAKALAFLGASSEPDEQGYYTIWSEERPDELPRPTRSSPK